MFLPAPFRLFEFDDSAVLGGAMGGRRWLPSWQGPALDLAEEVCLGWVGQDNQQVVVSTAHLCRHPTEQDRRHNAVFLVFGGHQLRRTPRADLAATHMDIEWLSRRDDVWIRGEVGFDGRPVAAYTAKLDQQTIAGYAAIGECIVCFGAVALPIAVMRLRAVTESAAAAYPANPTRPISDETLQALTRPA